MARPKDVVEPSLGAEELYPRFTNVLGVIKISLEGGLGNLRKKEWQEEFGSITEIAGGFSGCVEGVQIFYDTTATKYHGRSEQREIRVQGKFVSRDGRQGAFVLQRGTRGPLYDAWWLQYKNTQIARLEQVVYGGQCFTIKDYNCGDTIEVDCGRGNKVSLPVYTRI